jgi:hypothetical protein
VHENDPGAERMPGEPRGAGDVADVEVMAAVEPRELVRVELDGPARRRRPGDAASMAPRPSVCS